jgi:hypothetical protein
VSETLISKIANELERTGLPYMITGRPRDLEDVRSLMIKNPGVDRDYVRNWLKEFEESPEKSGLLNAFEDILSGIRA